MDTLQAELEEARLKQIEMAEQLVSQQAELDSAVEALARERELICWPMNPVYTLCFKPKSV